MARQQSNIAGVYDPDAVLTQKGALLGHDGTEPVEVPPGADGEAVVYDSSTASGLSSRPFTSAEQNITNAANAALFRLGM